MSVLSRPTRHLLALGALLVIATVATWAPPAHALSQVGPTTPTNLTITNLTTTSGRLCWMASTDGIGVVSYRITWPDGHVTTTGSTCILLTGLSQFTTYTFTVAAVDGAGNVSPAATVTFTTPGIGGPFEPSQPVALVASAVTDTAVTLTWGASTDDVAVAGYKVFSGTTEVSATVGATGTTIQLTGLTPAATYTFTVKAYDAAGNASVASTPVTVKLLGPGGLRPPGKVTASPILGTSVTICWEAPSSPVEVVGYDVFLGPDKVASTTGLCQNITGLIAATSYTVTVKARSASGELSAGSSVTFTTMIVDDFIPPTTPGKPIPSNITATSLTLTWAPSTDPSGISGYDVYDGSTKLASTKGSAPTASITGLAARPYVFTVKARDAYGITSAASEPTYFPIVCSDCGGAHHEYELAGSATLKTLVKGAVPLAGGLKLDYLAPTDDFTGTVTLQQTTANLTALGFLPVVAKLAFVPTAPVTGSLVKGVLTANAKVRIKLPSVTLFGMQLVGGSTCQTKLPSNLALKSGPSVTPTSPATLAGTFAISDLSGCGSLTGILSPLTAGKGNAIALQATPILN